MGGPDLLHGELTKRIMPCGTAPRCRRKPPRPEIAPEESAPHKGRSQALTGFQHNRQLVACAIRLRQRVSAGEQAKAFAFPPVFPVSLSFRYFFLQPVFLLHPSFKLSYSSSISSSARSAPIYFFHLPSVGARSERLWQSEPNR